MDKKKYIVIDSSEYADYFCRNLKSDYIPVTLNDHTKALLASQDINTIGILDYLGEKELKAITAEAFSASDRLLSKIDENNRRNYLKIFGNEELKLTHMTIGFLFRRFTVAALRLVRGLESIFDRQGLTDEIAYLHDGAPRIMCGAKNEKGFFFPDDVTWRILQSWRMEDKPGLKFIKTPRRNPDSLVAYKDMKRECLNYIRSIRILLSPIKKAIFGYNEKKAAYSSDKDSLLFLWPFYDFEPVLHSENLMKHYNILKWTTDSVCEPPGHNGVIAGDGISFPSTGADDGIELGGIDFVGLTAPLIREFYASKLADVLHYWENAKAVFREHKIAAVLWGNAPLRYPHGVLKEFFRLEGVPVCGMQHGGLTGSNELGQGIFDSDLNNCDYYLSYGFTKEDLETDAKLCASTIIPVGSTSIKKVYDEYGTGVSKRKKVDILFPVSLAVGEFYYENEMSLTKLFEFQKRIVDAMAVFSDKKIILKFPVGKYMENPLGIYVADRYPNMFMIVDHLSFTDCIKDFEPGMILIEEQSTPLNEALITDSNIAVYNDRLWAGLATRARALLSKRAVICDTEDNFIKTVCDYLGKGVIDRKDTANREFFVQYCVYKGDPKENIEKAIISIAHRQGRCEKKKDCVCAIKSAR